MTKQLSVLFSIVVLSSTLACGRAEAPAARPAATAHHAVVISIDGLRPDLLIRAEVPNIKSLMKQGSFSMWVRTTDIAVTLPSHTSMMTGVTPEKHGINFNNDGPDEPIYPNVPTLFELAKKVGYTTGIASGKSKFAILAKPGTVDYPMIPDKATTYEDRIVAEHAAELIKKDHVDVMLVHFPDNDKAGHKYGWGTPEQIDALTNADKAVGVVIQALHDAGTFDDTLIILSADHGGQGKSHGRDDMRSRYIPWIAVGPGVRKDLDLTRFKELNVRTEDTFATVCEFLDIPVPEQIDGKPVELIRESLELMKDAPATRPAGNGKRAKKAA